MKLTNEEIRIKLAEFMGYEREYVTPHMFGPNYIWKDLEGYPYEADEVPNYPEDLNAIREVELKLDHVKDTNLLPEVMGKWTQFDEYLHNLMNEKACENYLYVIASPLDRCKALIKTLKL
ncbi:hypothetical protein N9064_00535 [bacterium]|nr:hypothetical protein [bacterium]